MLRPTLGRRNRNVLAAAMAMALSTSFVAPHTARAQEPQWNWGTSRQLRTCPDKTSPAKGKMTVALATMYVACYYEEQAPYDASVYFVDISSLQVVTKRRASAKDTTFVSEIDPKKPVYVLQGSMVLHQCYNITTNEYGKKQGENCSRSELPKAKGKCVADLLGEWKCYLGGMDPSPKRKQPAPQ
jgi:hypothetical protein